MEIGTKVIVTRFDGTEVEGITRTAVKTINDEPMVWVTGLAGCYPLSRVKAVDTKAKQ